jgi:hypothetical protein
MTSADVAAQPSGAGWIFDYLPPPQELRFTSSRLPILSLELVTLAVLTAIAALALASVVSAQAALGAGATILGIFVAASLLLLRTTPEWRTKIVRRMMLADRRGEVERARATVGRLEAERRALTERERAAAEVNTRRLESTNLAETTERGSIDYELSTRLSEIAQRRRDAHSKEAAQLAIALRTEQQEHSRRELSRHTVANAGLPGIGSALLLNLQRTGIRTAADFTGVQLSGAFSYGHSSQVAYFRLANGSLVRVDGIGPKKAQPLAAWRSRLELAARASMPSRLSSGAEQAIRLRYANELQRVTSDEQAVRVAAAQRSAEASQRHQIDRAAIVAELQRVHQDGARERASVDTQLSQATQALVGAELPQTIAERELAACRQISYARYLAYGLGA